MEGRKCNTVALVQNTEEGDASPELYWTNFIDKYKFQYANTIK
jgi:hypothetical protein